MKLKKIMRYKKTKHKKDYHLYLKNDPKYTNSKQNNHLQGYMV